MKITYEFPQQLIPEFHTALYQLIVGVEQSHSASNLCAYAKRLRELADQATTTPKLPLCQNPD